MVTKAIERAQTTVEQKNAEIRKNVLKYDEVMNEQRKVIYKRRDQILDGEDLKSARHGVPGRGGRRADRDALRVGGDRRVGPRRPGQRAGAVLAVEARPPTSSSRRHDTDELYDLVMAEATAHYEQREERARRRRDARGRAPGDAAHHRPALARAPRGDGLPPGGHQPAGDGPEGPARRVAARGLRDVRRDDEGHRPGLRALRDARPGRAEAEQSRRSTAPTVLEHADDSSERRRAGPAGMRPGRRAGGGRGRPTCIGTHRRRRRRSKPATVVKDDFEKTPRNAPCPCGSGKKFKLCHGAT